jgi:thiamine pyrophosphate-dependent acetolactate synthase large subunit-like protein
VVKPHKPGGWMDPGPLGTLGVGTGFAMASKLTQPERDVVVLFGDGSFGLTGFDFETMVRNDLPFVGVIGNNVRRSRRRAPPASRRSSMW